MWVVIKIKFWVFLRQKHLIITANRRYGMETVKQIKNTETI